MIEMYEKFPKLIPLAQKGLWFWGKGFEEPRVEAQFSVPLVGLTQGCGYYSALDIYGKVHTWGDNYGSQLGTTDDIHRENPSQMETLQQFQVNKMSLGFQHCLYKDLDGYVHGVGKNNRYQLGKKKNEDSEN
jgi:alpha-tubulin suppressor-like RCC1 family protein